MQKFTFSSGCRPLRWAALMCCFALIAAGCAGLGKPIEAPKIKLAGIQVEEVSGLETVFQVRLRVFNTNDVDLVVTGINCDLEINDRQFATGVSQASVTIPSYGSELISLSLYSSVFSMFRSMLSMQQEEQLSYRLKGKLRLGGVPMQMPLSFDTEGKVSLEELTPRQK